MFFNVQVRNRDFMAAVRREVVNAGGCEITFEEIIRRAVDGGAPHYYSSYDYALNCCRNIRRGRHLWRGRRLEMWLEFYDKVKTLLMRCPSLGFTQAVARVLAAEPASGFFLSYRQAQSLYHEEIRHCDLDFWTGVSRSDKLRLLAEAPGRCIANHNAVRRG